MIAKATEQEYGALDTMMGGLVGTNADLNLATSNLRKEIGDALIPVVSQATGEIAKTINVIIEWVKINKSTLFPSLQAGYDIISGLGMLAFSVVGKIVTAITTLFAAIGQVLGRLSAAVEASFMQMGEAVKNFLTGDLDGAKQAGDNIRASFSTAFSGLSNDLVKMYDAAFSGLNKVGKEAESRVMKGFGSAFQLMIGEAPKVTAVTRETSKSTNDLTKYLQNNTIALDDSSEAKKRLREALKAAQRELDTLTRKYDLQIITEGEYRKGLDALISKYSGLMRSQKEGSDQWDVYSAIVKGARDALSDLNKTSEETQKRLAALRKEAARKDFISFLSLDEIERRLAEIPKLLKKATSPEQLDDVLNLERLLLDRKGELESAFEDAGRWMGEALQDGLMEAGKPKQNPSALFGLDEIKRNLGDIATQDIPEVVTAVESLLQQGYLNDADGSITAWLKTLKDRAEEAAKAIDALAKNQQAYMDRQSGLDFAAWEKSLSTADVKQLQGYRSVLQSQLDEQLALSPMDQDPALVAMLDKRIATINGIIKSRVDKGVADLQKALEVGAQRKNKAYQDALEMAAIGPDVATNTPPGDTQGLDSLLPPVQDITALVEQYKTAFADDPFGLEGALLAVLETSDEGVKGFDVLMSALTEVQDKIHALQMQFVQAGGDLQATFKPFGEVDFVDVRDRVLSLSEVVSGLQKELKDKPEALADALLELAASTPEGTDGLLELHQALLDVLKLVEDPARRNQLGQKFLDSLLGDGDWKDIKFVDDLERVFDQLVGAGFGDTTLSRAIADRITEWRKELGQAPSEGQSFFEFATQGLTDFEATSDGVLDSLKLIKDSYGESADKSGLLKDLQELEQFAVTAGLEGSDALKAIRSSIADVQADMMKPGYGEGLAQGLLNNLFGDGFEFDAQSEDDLIKAWNLLVDRGLGGTKAAQAVQKAMMTAIEAGVDGEVANELRDRFWEQLKQVDFNDPEGQKEISDAIRGTIGELRDLGLDVSGFEAIWATYERGLSDVAGAQDYLSGMIRKDVPAYEKQAVAIEKLAEKASGPLADALRKVAAEIRRVGSESDAFETLKARVQGVAGVLKDIGGKFSTLLGANLGGLGNLLSTGFGIFEQVKKGDFFGAVIAGIGSVIDALSGFQRAAEEARKANEDFQKQFSLIDGSAFGGAYTRSRGLLADLFGGGPEVVRWANELAVTIAKALEGGVKSGLGSGIKNFLEGTGNVLDGLKDGIKGAIINGITEAVIQGAIVKGALGALLTDLTKAFSEGNMGVAAGIVNQITGILPNLAGQIEQVIAPLKGAIGGLSGSTGVTAPSVSVGSLPVGVQFGVVTEFRSLFQGFGEHVMSFGRAVQQFADGTLVRVQVGNQRDGYVDTAAVRGV